MLNIPSSSAGWFGTILSSRMCSKSLRSKMGKSVGKKTTVTKYEECCQK